MIWVVLLQQNCQLQQAGRLGCVRLVAAGGTGSGFAKPNNLTRPDDGFGIQLSPAAIVHCLFQ
jgi:hypothetical protein